MSGNPLDMITGGLGSMVSGLFGSGSGGASLPGAQQLLGQGANLSGIGQQLMAAQSSPQLGAGLASGLQTASMNPASVASSVPSITNPFSQMTANLDTQMNEPPGAVVTPNQAANNSQALQQLQQLGQASSAWAPTANVLQNIIRQQQQPVRVTPGHASTVPSNPVPINLGAAGNPATTPALSSPLARYAMLLKGIQ